MLQEPLPDFPLSGMLNKTGGKVRLTFKLEQDQLWIGTKERTDKIPMNSIKGVHNEPIHDHPEYHMVVSILFHLRTLQFLSRSTIIKTCL